MAAETILATVQHALGVDEYGQGEQYRNRWHPTHMLRGILVGGDYPFVSCDSTSLAQNHHRYRLRLFAGTPDEWSGIRAYADKLERQSA